MEKIHTIAISARGKEFVNMTRVDIIARSAIPQDQTKNSVDMARFQACVSNVMEKVYVSMTK